VHKAGSTCIDHYEHMDGDTNWSSFSGQKLVVVMNQSSKVQCSVYSGRPSNIKNTPLGPQCIIRFI
jgi:hypothetical protein